MSGAATMLVCTTCCGRSLDATEAERRAGQQIYVELREEAARAELRLQVRPTDCLANCGNGCSIALVARHKPTYVLGGLRPGEAGVPAAMVDLGLAYADHATGEMDLSQTIRPALVSRHPSRRRGSPGRRSLASPPLRG